MIYDSIQNYKAYLGLSQNLDRALETLASLDGSKLRPGASEIDGDRFFINLMEVETAPADEKKWEAHRAYIDIHWLLAGDELAEVSALDAMKLTEEYAAENDCAFYEGPAQSQCRLGAGMFLVCFPQDVHRACIRVPGCDHVRKIVLKVAVD